MTGSSASSGTRLIPGPGARPCWSSAGQKAGYRAGCSRHCWPATAIQPWAWPISPSLACRRRYPESRSNTSPGPCARWALVPTNAYPALGVAYSAEPGLPQTLSRIPLEYFAGALRWLARQPGVDPARIAVLGVSRGSEAAQLPGVYYPNLVHRSEEHTSELQSLRHLVCR